MTVRIRQARQRRCVQRRSLVLEPLETRNLLASFITAEDTPLVGTDPAVLLALIESPPAHGKVTAISPATGDVEPSGPPLGGGGFSYVPDQNYNGPDRFIYRIARMGTTAEAVTVSLTITPVNDAPVAVNDSFNASANGALEITSAKILSNDTDVDSNALTVLFVAGSGPKHGTLTTSASGNFVYKPNPQFVGPDSFSYFAWDGQAFSATSASVTIKVEQVNHPPEARDDSYVAQQDRALTIQSPGVLANDGLVAGILLTASLVDKPVHGNVTLNANGSFVYTPPASFTGADTFTYRASLGASNTDPLLPTPIVSNIATVTITVKPLNEPPKANNDQYTATQGVELAVKAPGVLANDKGGANDKPLYAYPATDPGHGTLTLKPDGSFAYKPAANYTGLDSFTYRASTTPPESASPIADGSVATVTIFVKPFTPPPEARNDHFVAVQNKTLTIPAPGVLANDGFLANFPLSAVLVANPANGTLTLNANGSLTYVSAPDFHGADSFTYRATTPATPGADPTNTNPPIASNVATVTISVLKPITLPPAEALDDFYLALQGTTLTIQAPGVLANDGGTATHPLAAAVVNGPANGTLTLNANGSFTYVPRGDFNGSDSFTYRLSDSENPPTDPATGAGRTAIVTIKVLGLNHPPIARNDQFATVQGATLTVAAPGVLANDGSIASPQALTAEVVTGPAHGTLVLNTNGSFVYLPSGDFSGPDSFVYRATSTASGIVNSSTATVTIVVAKPNPLHNIARPPDVDGNSEIAPLDALLIINHLNRLTAEGEAGGGYFDVNGDGEVAPLDALLVINWLNARQAGAEGEGDVSAESDLDETLELLSIDAAEQTARRKRTN